MKRLALCFGLMLVFAGLFAQTEKGSVHIKNGTVITITDGVMENTDVLIENGIITRIGKNLRTPSGARAVDATGQYVMPGIIDAHSHIALDAVNEATNVVTAEVWTGDVLDPMDVSIYRALAGGVTASHAMHGSANAIGGQCETIKHRYGTYNPDDLKMVGAPRTIKFALGENPMRVHGEGNRIIPRTRMGVEQVFRQAFSEGKAYMEAWDAYEKKKATDATAVPPKYDRRMETMADILKGDIIIHCHSYRADEILMLMNVCRDFGVKRLVYQHVNEGFKVAPELAEFGAGASVFADWWAYKFEVYYSTAYNAAILTKNGVVTSINSDSGDYIRHLFHQAGKTQRYGGLTDNEALRLITLNPAIQLGIDDRVGSIEKGKDGDIAIFSAHPLSIYAVPQMTIVDGIVRFDIKEDSDDMRLDVNPETTDNMMLEYDEDHRCMEGVSEQMHSHKH
ncbi:amidohydrolase family protein [Lewinella sp. W8]|uniref:amidohydrolase family protein n=1 Tax=Lewinella sp. W8 TaxID=2528208 RepID=UPI001067E65B|nr:amidohydrolase family protein [Lewinella sp. W8]MTB53704.1 amidohydrolase family protein [Lewinella sp. W8]